MRNLKTITAAVRKLQNDGIQVSLFIDPEPVQVDAAGKSGAEMIELNTRAFSETCPRSPDLAGADLQHELVKVVAAANRGADLRC